jgi:hypothetical protein
MTWEESEQESKVEEEEEDEGEAKASYRPQSTEDMSWLLEDD